MISKLIKNQELRAYYLGRAVRIKISELDAVMTTKAVDGRAQ
jgi:excisionase family DNA binding protein